MVELSQSKERMEEALKESEHRFREILEKIALLAIMLDTRGNITFINDYLLLLSGWRREEVIGKNWFDNFIPHDQLQVKKMFFHTIERGEVAPHYENEILTKKKERRLIRFNNIVQHDKEGKVIGTVSIGEDITDYMRAQEGLRVSEERYRQLFECSIDILVLIDDRGQILDINQRGESLTGYKKKDLIGRSLISLTDIFPSESLGMIVDSFNKRIQGIDVKPYHVELKSVDGRGLCFEIYGIPVRDGSGKNIGDLAILHDITEQKQTEDALRESEENYRSLIEGSVSTVATFDRDGKLLFMNRIAAQMLGGKPEDYVGKTMWDVFPEEIADRQIHSVRQVIDTKKGIVVESHTMIRGRERLYTTSIQPITIRKQPLAMLVATDITGRAK